MDLLTAIGLGFQAAEFIAAQIFDDDEVTPAVRAAAEDIVLSFRIIDAISRGNQPNQEDVAKLRAQSYSSNAALHKELDRRRRDTD